jgi:hypothetical protein
MMVPLEGVVSAMGGTVINKNSKVALLFESRYVEVNLDTQESRIGEDIILSHTGLVWVEDTLYVPIEIVAALCNAEIDSYFYSVILRYVNSRTIIPKLKPVSFARPKENTMYSAYYDILINNLIPCGNERTNLINSVIPSDFDGVEIINVSPPALIIGNDDDLDREDFHILRGGLLDFDRDGALDLVLIYKNSIETCEVYTYKDGEAVRMFKVFLGELTNGWSRMIVEKNGIGTIREDLHPLAINGSHAEGGLARTYYVPKGDSFARELWYYENNHMNNMDDKRLIDYTVWGIGRNKIEVDSGISRSVLNADGSDNQTVGSPEIEEISANANQRYGQEWEGLNLVELRKLLIYGES